ncbi:hypothetical protein BHM03_00030945 [Ensete ventricosum]|nr:hypothetical protein BHM03_00030945 [Ensete ventricosum]
MAEAYTWELQSVFLSTKGNCSENIGVLKRGGRNERVSDDGLSYPKVKRQSERRGRTSVESSNPCSYGWRTLVMKEAEEVENAEANSKYQDKAERVEAKELHKTSVNRLFIKIAESVGTLG